MMQFLQLKFNTLGKKSNERDMCARVALCVCVRARARVTRNYQFCCAIANAKGGINYKDSTEKLQDIII